MPLYRSLAQRHEAVRAERDVLREQLGRYRQALIDIAGYENWQGEPTPAMIAARALEGTAEALARFACRRSAPEIIGGFRVENGASLSIGSIPRR